MEKITPFVYDLAIPSQDSLILLRIGSIDWAYLLLSFTSFNSGNKVLLALWSRPSADIL